jgi:hypothetical protein
MLDKTTKTVMVLAIVVFLILSYFAVTYSIAREEKCSKVNGIVIHSNQGWICVDSHIIKG